MKNLKHFLILSLVFVSITSSFSQNDKDPRWEAFSKRENTIINSQFANVNAQNIGPTVFSGRVSDIAVNPEDPSEFYVGYASGGLWHTKNNGTTFDPIFDHEAVMTIGDIAVDWKTNTIWVGTGEVNSSRSSYAGVGIYKSTDNGKSWTHHGLDDTHHIGRIVLHPKDSNIAWIAALGHLYSTNEERGVFKTVDGGKTWTKTLFVDNNSGAVDLVMDSTDPSILYAATWDRIRHAWDFQESGLGSGIYKSTDGGDTWSKMSTDTSGFPNNEGTGRIGLDFSYSKENGKVIYAILDNYNRRPNTKKIDPNKLSKNSFVDMTKDEFLALNDEKIGQYLAANRFPKKYSASSIKAMVRNGNLLPIALKEFTENANSLLFDTPVIGAEVYISKDEGKTWTKTHSDYLDGLYNSYGYYFGQVKVNPIDANQLYVMGVPILRSDDGGANWTNINGQNVHSDHHSLWINPNNPRHIINGNDGGINISYDNGESWIKCNSPSVGQFYYINVDNASPYNVYGGTQDNGVWGGSHQYREGTWWHNSGSYPYERLMGGDGMQVQIDNRDNNTVYTGFQFGNYFRIDKANETRKYITPMHKLGDRPYRWNWQSPVLLSPHNQDIFYMGANKLLRSMDQGETFEPISDDLTNGGKKGDVAFGTLTSISESTFKFGLIYTGSDDGKVYRTDDGGNSWNDISGGLPANKWISRIQASMHDENKVYLSLNGYRDDDFSSYVYVSNDKGETWNSISATLPSEPVNVIKEDPSYGKILYVGTDHGTYVSLDMGTTFSLIANDIPKTPVHDVVIQDRDEHLLIGTHGRSIYKIDIAPLRALSDINESLYLYESDKIKPSSSWGKRRNVYSKYYEPDHTFMLYSNNGGKGKMEIHAGKQLIQSQDIDIQKGISEVHYDLSIDPAKTKNMNRYLKKIDKKSTPISPADNGTLYLPAGIYNITITIDGQKASRTFEIGS